MPGLKVAKNELGIWVVYKTFSHMHVQEHKNVKNECQKGESCDL